MTITVRIAIGTYAKLTNRTFNEVAEQMKTDKAMEENIVQLAKIYESNKNWIFAEDNTDIYTLDSPSYNKTFNSVFELVDDVIISGTNPNYEITCNNKPISHLASDFCTT